MKNSFIVFEGIDGSGKTTLVNYLKSKLPDESFFFTKEPLGSDIGLSIKNILYYATQNNDSMSQMLAFALDRSYHIKQVVLPKLTEGFSVVSDRFVYSSLAYQGLFINRDLIQSIFSMTNYGVDADVIFFCDIDPQVALTRMKARKDNNFLDSVYESKLYQLRDAYRTVFSDKKNVITLEMNQNVEEIGKTVLSYILS
jgi:dTMP kinase